MIIVSNTISYCACATTYKFNCSLKFIPKEEVYAYLIILIE